MSTNNKHFKFKEDFYTMRELLILNRQGKNLYISGKVKDMSDDFEFDIVDIKEYKTLYHEELHRLATSLESEESKIIKVDTEAIKRRRDVELLNVKYEEGTINLEDLELLLKYESNIQPYHNYYVTISNKGGYYKKYHSYEYPKELTHSQAGKLLFLLDFMTYKNEIKKTPRDNSKYPSTEDLMKALRITNLNTLNRSLKELKDLGVIDYRRKDSKKVIYINPILSDRGLKLHPEVYIRFKEDIDKVITGKESRYLELLCSDDGFGCLILSD